MTKSEFIQRVAIALVGNPKFVTYSEISYSEIIRKAETLADCFEEKSNCGGFDDMSDGEFVAQKLGDIEEEMEREFDIEHDIK